MYPGAGIDAFLLMLLLAALLVLLIAWVLLPIFIYRQLGVLREILYEQKRISRALAGEPGLLPGQLPPRR